MFDKGDVKRVEDSTRGVVSEAVSFGVWVISDESAWSGMAKDLGIMSLDEHEGSATNFPQVTDEGDCIEPEFM